MKKRGTKLFTFLLTAGMLVVTAASGISANMITSTKTTAYQMKENDSVLVDDRQNFTGQKMVKQCGIQNI